MSLVLLIVVKDQNAFVFQEHFRDILRRLNESDFESQALWMDAGYVLVDFDSSTIISSQEAFAFKDIKNKLFRRLSWVRL